MKNEELTKRKLKSISKMKKKQRMKEIPLYTYAELCVYICVYSYVNHFALVEEKKEKKTHHYENKRKELDNNEIPLFQLRLVVRMLLFFPRFLSSSISFGLFQFFSFSHPMLQFFKYFNVFSLSASQDMLPLMLLSVVVPIRMTTHPMIWSQSNWMMLMISFIYCSQCIVFVWRFLRLH